MDLIGDICRASCQATCSPVWMCSGVSAGWSNQTPTASKSTADPASASGMKGISAIPGTECFVGC